MIRGWHFDGEACYSLTCAQVHRPPLGESEVAEDPDGTVRIQRRSLEDRERYLRDKRAELVAAGKLEEAQALDVVAGWDVHTVVDGAGEVQARYVTGESSALRERRDGEAVEDHLDRRAAEVAAAFHAEYETLAPQFGYRTRSATAKPWAEIPDDDSNKRLMIAVAHHLLTRGVIA